MSEVPAVTGRPAVVVARIVDPSARAPRRDSTSADAGSLARMGRLGSQPVPAPSIRPFLEPDLPPFVEE